MEKPQNIENMYLKDQGVVIEIPPHWSKHITFDPETEKVTIDPNTQTKILAVNEDSIMKERYPTPQHGWDFMEEVSPEWRKFLYQKAEEMTEAIVHCNKLKGNPLAVVL